MPIDMVLISAGLLAFGILMYVLLDGFDLGVGILFPWAPRDDDRHAMMSSIAPVWDGNGTWLIYGGGILFAAFPTAYAILLHALYVPLMVMLIALMFRGVAFEFRLKANKSRWVWDCSFAGGSTLAAFMQGVMLGSVIQGFDVVNGSYQGGPWDWLNSFSITTGFALVMGYGMLGASWLIFKTRDLTEQWAYSIAKPLAVILSIFILMVSLKTPLQYPHIAERWFSLPNFWYLSPFPLLTLACLYGLWRNLRLRQAHHLPLLFTMGIFVLCYFGLLISLWPHIVMPNITFWQASAPPSSLKFVLVVAAVSMPIVIGYSIYIYRVFRGKVEAQTNFYAP